MCSGWLRSLHESVQAAITFKTSATLLDTAELYGKGGRTWATNNFFFTKPRAKRVLKETYASNPPSLIGQHLATTYGLIGRCLGWQHEDEHSTCDWSIIVVNHYTG